MSAAQKLYSPRLFRPAQEPTRFLARGASARLAVLVHGYTGMPSSMRHVRAVIEAVDGDCDILSPRYDAQVFSLADPVAIAARIVADIDAACARRVRRGAPYRGILLLGHSLGALLVRQAFLTARAAALRGGESGQWYARVERIVLVAGMNRGWSITHHQSRATGVIARLASAAGNLITTIAGRRPLVFEIRRGAPFVTSLRLAWHAATRDGGPALPPTVQLLGTVDDLVSPQDNVDLLVDRGFTYLTVPRSGHADVILMAADPDERPSASELAVRRARAAVLRDAVASADVATSPHAVALEADAGTAAGDGSVTDVVFVIHGIRDHGYWTEKIALEVQRLAAAQHAAPRRFARENASYGYFTMLPFLRPAERRSKVEWLMDRYVERRVRHPQARFHYVGHSNGTYLLAKALADYPACSFDSVVFAGSVVHTRYPWARFLGGRVKRVMNYVATGDWVVAAFPNGLEQIGVQDLGAAGHQGFAAATEPSVDTATRRSPDGALVEIRYVRGAHGAAIAEDHWPQIARFVVLGEVAGIAGALASDRQEDWVSRLGRGAWLIWITALVVAALLAVWLALTVATVGIVPYLPLLAAGLVWYVVTRV